MGNDDHRLSLRVGRKEDPDAAGPYGAVEPRAALDRAGSSREEASRGGARGGRARG